jgi:hypothetical protein
MSCAKAADDSSDAAKAIPVNWPMSLNGFIIVLAMISIRGPAVGRAN